MIKLWRLFVNRQIVKVIQAAMVHDDYDRIKYLCNTIHHTSNSFWQKITIRRIGAMLNNRSTLYCHILHELVAHDWMCNDSRTYTYLDWPEKKVVHVKFWNLAITALLNGHGAEPVTFTPEQLGLEKGVINEAISHEDL